MFDNGRRTKNHGGTHLTPFECDKGKAVIAFVLSLDFFQRENVALKRRFSTCKIILNGFDRPYNDCVSIIPYDTLRGSLVEVRTVFFLSEIKNPGFVRSHRRRR